MSKYKSNRYQLGIALQTTKHHPGYSENLSASENVRKGKDAGRSYAHIAKELQAIANITHKRVFEDAAEQARGKAHRLGEYEKPCEHCGKMHSMRKKMAMA